MYLSGIFIKNFRSIKEISIDVKPTCQVFVGTNESGKSNILKALSLLKKDQIIEKKDVRVQGKKEGTIRESYLDFVFSLSEEERQGIKEYLASRVHFDGEEAKSEFLNSMDLVKKNKRIFDTIKLRVDIFNDNRKIKLDNSSEITGIGKLKPGTPAQKIKDKGSAPINPSGTDIYDLNLFDEQTRGFFEECDFDCLLSSLWGHIEKLLPEVIYWKNSEQTNLPEEIDLETFKNNPESCIPLKIMFNLADVIEIKKDLDALHDQGAIAMEGAIESIAEKTNVYFKNIWKDYSNVIFDLQLNKNVLKIRIKDEENKYSYEQRSDGFKRFVSFLLLLSGKTRNNEIKNAIIILDEPELGIQITGQEYLTKELIHISKNNMVFYATHSIFMIGDRESLGQFIVKKNKDITTIVKVDESNYIDNEVTFRAMGFSVFKTMQKENIIFEGWSDKKVFKLSTGEDNYWLGKGQIHSKGTSSIKCIAKILELAQRNYFVISDSDEAARNSRKAFEEDSPQGNWYTYEDILGEEIYTLEDFIKHESYTKTIEEIEAEYNLSKFDMSGFKNTNLKRIEYIKEWIREKENGSTDSKDILKELKRKLYTSIEKEDLEDRYFDLIKKLKEKIEKDNWHSENNLVCLSTY